MYAHLALFLIPMTGKLWREIFPDRKIEDGFFTWMVRDNQKFALVFDVYSVNFGGWEN